MFVKYFQLCSVVLVASFTQALVPLQSTRRATLVPPQHSQFHSRRSRPIKTSLRDKYATDSAAGNFEKSFVPSNTTTSQDGTDFGTDIFLNNLDANLATKEILEHASEVAVEKMAQTTKFSNDTAAFLEGRSGAPVNENVPVYEGKTVQDTVSSILAMSSEAVELAEETLKQQVTFEGVNSTDEQTHFSKVQEIPIILPASDVVGDKPSEKITAPSVGKILKFAIPAIGVWLCGPLLSLIDTSSVGILSGTVQQAALNPAVAVTDYAALLIAYLYTATTNMIAEARETDRDADGKMPRTTRTFIGALQMSTFVGAGLGAFLFVFAKQLLRAIIGNDGISPAVFAAAMKYVRIRAIGMPAAAVIGSAQAACLGMQDIRSPLYVLFAAAVVNFMGDMLFVGSTHPLIGGAAGAAWATVFSQYAAMGLFLLWLTHKPKDSGKARVMDVSKAILELTGKPTSAGKSRRKKFLDNVRNLRLTKAKTQPEKVVGEPANTEEQIEVEEKPQVKQEKPFTVRGFLSTGFHGRDLLKFPKADVVKDFSPYVVPVTSTQVGRVSGYVAMSHVVSSALGTTSMAAQQVIVSLFYCLCPIADSLSLTAQSFVPSIAGKKISRERAAALKKLALNFVKAGAVFGSFMVGAVACIPLVSRFFTTDAQVVALVNKVSPLLLGFFGVHGILCACEGLLLGQKDLGFLGRSYAAYFFIVPYFMMQVKRAALAGTHAVSLTSVWTVFLAYQFSRVTAWGLRALWLQRRTDREASRVAP